MVWLLLLVVPLVTVDSTPACDDLWTFCDTCQHSIHWIMDRRVASGFYSVRYTVSRSICFCMFAFFVFRECLQPQHLHAHSAVTSSFNNPYIPYMPRLLLVACLTMYLFVPCHNSDAQDDDVIAINNLQSKARSSFDVKDCCFYAVAMDWFQAAWPALNFWKSCSNNKLTATCADRSIPLFGDNWKQEIGPIRNTGLLDSATGVSSSVEAVAVTKAHPCSINRPTVTNNTSAKPDFLNELHQHAALRAVATPLTTKATATTTRPPLKPGRSPEIALGKVYPRDFVLVSANVWLLLRQKFGFDVEVPCPCEYNAVPSRTELGKLLARIHAAKRVSVPMTGRFPYEQFMTASTVENSQQPQTCALPPPQLPHPSVYRPILQSQEEEDTLVCC
jgi:hypothetical protein